jgi:hypothetical protein
MRGFLLKAGATALTLLTTAASAWYVAGHLKNPAAPLQPPVLASEQDGPISLGPSVHQADVQPITSTYAS